MMYGITQPFKSAGRQSPRNDGWKNIKWRLLEFKNKISEDRFRNIDLDNLIDTIKRYFPDSESRFSEFKNIGKDDQIDLIMYFYQEAEANASANVSFPNMPVKNSGGVHVNVSQNLENTNKISIEITNENKQDIQQLVEELRKERKDKSKIFDLALKIAPVLVGLIA
ncbi:MAG: hypothetical protein V1936_05270 [Patescibacteria group bacterium]